MHAGFFGRGVRMYGGGDRILGLVEALKFGAIFQKFAIKVLKITEQISETTYFSIKIYVFALK